MKREREKSAKVNEEKGGDVQCGLIGRNDPHWQAKTDDVYIALFNILESDV